ncbi:matrixin family metalloprotease [uncultured Paracoccus sp.]|uniref:matrixin family metalloprotease n=1 Tax=uncultured Paracoccus sp. TaxID=189685 RepID=UPI0026350D47|nr:matrixin family metalloprotease [uncultured Paracoccus sp.]
MAYVSNYTALTTGVWRWNKAEKVGTPTVVTYSFLERGELPSFSESPPAQSDVGNQYVPMTTAQRAAIRSAMAQFEAKSGLRFVEVNDPADASIKLHGNRSPDLTSWAYLPPTPSVGGDIQTGDVFVTITYDPNQSWTTSSARGSSIYTVMIHEIGHAIGLEHPHEGRLLMPSMDNHDYTVMSYDWSWSGDSTGRSRDTLGPLDVQAIRYLYGDSAGYTAVWRPAGQFLEIDGGAGNDSIVTGRAPSLMLGGAGHDRLTGAQFNDTLKGASGNDRLDGAAGNDQLAGHVGNDHLLGGSGNDTLFGIEGSDLLWGETGNDRLNGGAGNDTLDGGYGVDWLSGFDGADLLRGGAENDLLQGGGGADTLAGGAGQDRLFGDADADLLSGAEGDDQLYGMQGDDRLVGGDGRDALIGADGRDRLEGNAGDDRLVGGSGNDRLNGAAGADVFAFRGRLGLDVIEDWQDGVDQISLQGYAGFDDFDDVAAAARQRGNLVSITLSLDSIILLTSTTLSDLDDQDFTF